MAKTKNKTHSESENLKGYIRELEAQVRSMQKEIRRFEKYERQQHDSEPVKDSEDTKVELKKTCLCPSCEKHKMVETLDLGPRGLFGQCICGYTGKMK